MNELNLTEYLKSYLNWRLAPYVDADVLSEDLADALKNNGYCMDPYSEYDKALICPINKRREKYCGCTHCASYKFCIILRKEAYI